MTNIPGKDSNPQSRSHCITIITVVVLCFLGAVPPLMISTIYTTTFLNSATFVSNDPVVCTRILKALRHTDLDEEDNERIRMSSVLQTGGEKEGIFTFKGNSFVRIRFVSNVNEQELFALFAYLGGFGFSFRT